MAEHDLFGVLEREAYICLETFRRDGTGVRTPVWFAATGTPRRLFVYTTRNSGKIKRIRRNGTVWLAACGVAGRIKGPWIAARAAIVPAAEAGDAMRLINRKYWPWKQLLDLFHRVRPGPGRAVIAIDQNG